MAKLWVIGSSNVDYVFKTDHIAKPGETVIARSFKKFTGGKGFNQAAAAKQLVSETQFISAIGEDQDGEMVLDQLTSLQFEQSYIKRSSQSPTGTACIQVDQKGENSIVVNSGANFSLNLDHLMRFESDFKMDDRVVLQAELSPTETVEIIQWLKSKKICIFLNPAPFFPFDRQLLEGIDTLIVNETECQSLLQHHKISSFENVSEKLGINHIVRTRGSEGVDLLSGKQLIHIDALKVTVKDTTGAGDAFVGCYSAARFKGNSTLEAVHVGNQIAAYAVSVEGAQPTIPVSMKI